MPRTPQAERAHPVALALAVYLAVTVVAPWLRGASNDPAFPMHASTVCALAVLFTLLAWLFARARRRRVARRPPGVRPSRLARWRAHAEHDRRNDPHDDPPRRAGRRPPPARAR